MLRRTLGRALRAGPGPAPLTLFVGFTKELKKMLLYITLGIIIGHGAMTQPISRNAIDGSTAPWSGAVPTEVPFMFW